MLPEICPENSKSEREYKLYVAKFTGACGGFDENSNFYSSGGLTGITFISHHHVPLSFLLCQVNRVRCGEWQFSS